MKPTCYALQLFRCLAGSQYNMASPPEALAEYHTTVSNQQSAVNDQEYSQAGRLAAHEFGRLEDCTGDEIRRLIFEDWKVGT